MRGVVRLPHRRSVRVRLQPRGRGRVAADLGVARRDGRRVGAVRSLGAVAARRHRHRVGVRFRQVVAVEARGDVGAATRPVLPRSAGRRPRVARRDPGARVARLGQGHRARLRGSGRAQPAQREGQPERAGRGRLLGRGVARGAVRAGAAARARLPADLRRRGCGGARPGRPGPGALRPARVDPGPRSPHRGAPAGYARSHVVDLDDAGRAQGGLRRRTRST